MTTIQRKVAEIQELLKPILDESKLGRACWVEGGFNTTNNLSVLYSSAGLDYITEIRGWSDLAVDGIEDYIGYVKSGYVVPYQPWTPLELLAREAE